MSTQQRTAHLTGFNNGRPGQQPERGSFYAPVGGGAPGILGGPTSGFTLAFTLHNHLLDSGAIWGDGPESAELQFVVGCPGAQGVGNDGWIVLVEDTFDITVGISAAEIVPAEEVYEQDVLVVASYVPDEGLYGGVADQSIVVSSFNGNMDPGSGQEQNFGPHIPGNQFSLLGTAASVILDGEEISGCRWAQLGSFWITPGIPNQRQLQDFVQAAMRAGEVVPAAWAVARTASDLDPAVPDAPTGHHWSANDVDINQGLGGTWTDRIGGVVLERVGTISGVERELSRDPQYYFPNPSGGG